MKVITQIEFNLTMSSTQGLYDRNFNATLLRCARENYEGKCYDKQLIVSIRRIVKRSLPNLIKRDLDAKVRCFVVVEAEVIRFDRYDTICDMKVIKTITRGKIGPHDLLECSNQYCKAIIQLNEELNEYKAGDIIPVKVGTASLHIQSTQVNIKAFPFIPLIETNVAYKISKLSNSDKECLDTFIESINSQLSIIQELETDSKKQGRIAFFKDLLYPFKEHKKSNIGTVHDLFEFVNSIDSHVNKYAYIDQSIDLNELKISTITAKQAEDNNIVISGSNPPQPMHMIMSIITSTYAKHLDTIINLSSTYLDNEMFERHQYLWNLYSKYKL